MTMMITLADGERALCGWAETLGGPPAPSIPDAHYVLTAEFVAEALCEHENLSSVMRVVLHQIRQHVNHAPRHSLDARLARSNGGLEQRGEICRRLPQRTLRLHPRTREVIEGWRPRTCPAHPGERAPYALYVRHDCRDGAAPAAGWWRAPDRVWQNAHQVLVHAPVVLEFLEELLLDLERTISRHMHYSW
jgi:hypothetical protein